MEPRAADLPAAGPLPRGRHRLTREQVAASQRDRLLQGMIDAVAGKGYVRTSVADVLKRARVSRETFYEHFADKQDCFLAAYALAADLMVAVVTDAPRRPGDTPLDLFDHALTAYLDALAADAARSRTFLLEIYAVGPDATAYRFAVQRRFVRLIADALREDPRWQALPDPDFTGLMLVGGIASMVSGKVASGEHADLPALRVPILDHVRRLLDATRR
ncbi:TetR/AcrR family transcriptional regulator [Spirillospora sp. NPDC050679]